MMIRKRHFSLIATGALLLLAFVAGSASGGEFVTYKAQLDGSGAPGVSGWAILTIDYDLEGEPEFLRLNAQYLGLTSPVNSAAFYSGPPSMGGSHIWSVGTTNPLVNYNLVIPLLYYAAFVQALYGDNLYFYVNGDPAKLANTEEEIGGTFTLFSTVDDDTKSWGDIKALFR